MFFDWAEHFISRLKSKKNQRERRKQVPKDELIREWKDG